MRRPPDARRLPGLRRLAGGLAVGALAGFLGGLAACESAVQRQRLDTCRRAVPALAPSGTSVTLLRAGTGSAPDSVRVDYAAGPRRHWALCRFNAGAVLTGISTDRAALSEAALYLLKRYYLDTPDAAEPGPAAP